MSKEDAAPRKSFGGLLWVDHLFSYSHSNPYHWKPRIILTCFGCPYHFGCLQKILESTLAKVNTLSVERQSEENGVINLDPSFFFSEGAINWSYLSLEPCWGSQQKYPFWINT